ncbi:MAG: peptidoglycan-binding protein, partial [Clostridia bacterium]|nr:peptidoglycan-binding protein [Clostridia bacterium]
MTPFVSRAASTPYKGIDVSSWQGSINWEKVKNGGVDFAIIRCFAYRKDTRFDEYYSGATAKGIPVGSYVYMYAETAAEARAEAKSVLDVLGKKKLTFPLFLDVEDSSLQKLGKKTLTDLMIIELEEFKKAGYTAGIYTTQYYESAYMEPSRLANYDHWYAKWTCYAPDNDSSTFNHNSQDPYVSNPPAHMWQFSNGGDGKALGIASKFVDLNFCYYDYMNISRDIYPYTSADPDLYPVPTRTLEYNTGFSKTSGADVAWVQAVLNKLGYSTPMTGVYDLDTKNSVGKLQKDYGMNPDCITGRYTISLLTTKWNAINATLSTFNLNAGDSTGKTITFRAERNKSFKMPQCPYTYSAHTFTGWYVYRA